MKPSQILPPGQARNELYERVRDKVKAGAAACANDLDRVQLAFKALRKMGYLTRANTACCGGCLTAEVATDVEKRTGGEDLDLLPAEQKAWVGWNRQSNSALDDRTLVGHLHLAWGGPDGVEVAGLMAHAGLRVEWDGSGSKTILLVPRPDVPHKFSNPNFYAFPNQNCAICSRLEDEHRAWQRNLDWNRRRRAA